MFNVLNVTPSDFKSQFAEFPYLPVYIEGKAYFKGDIVYYNLNFYTSLIDANLTSPTDATTWQLANDSPDNYIQDNDILRAVGEASVNFNPSFYTDNAKALMVFLYLVAHYLVIDLDMRANPLATGFIGFTQSKSVGSVSESYAVPQWVLKNASLSQFGTTKYGRKYLSLVAPYLVGNIILTPGRTTCG